MWKQLHTVYSAFLLFVKSKMTKSFFFFLHFYYMHKNGMRYLQQNIVYVENSTLKKQDSFHWPRCENSE